MVVEPVVETAAAETAAAETMGCEGSAAKSTAPNCGRAETSASGRAEAAASNSGRAETSTSAKAAADAQLREAEAKLANLEKEVAELRAFAERESAAELQRLRAATETDAQKIAAAAKAEIEAAERAARLELKALAANLAVDGAETLLAKQLTPKTQESLISNFVKSLEGRPN